MTHSTSKIELLSPAGSLESLRAAVTAGCDAIYIGGSRFGARAFADNPDCDGLLEGIRYAHRHNVRVYLTVNTLVRETELSEVVPFLKPYYEAGLDAVIVQDRGVMEVIAEAYPDLDIHASTQMTVFHEKAFALLPKQVTRVVPARELTLNEIRSLCAASKLETEVFVHGALCYCYSGQCLMSSMIGGRSGNRGRCAQPCRKEYRYFSEAGSGSGKREYTLNLKDQCLLPLLPELIIAGVDSLKIEGRMKRPEYCAVVTSIYRKWLDRYYALGDATYREYVRSNQREMLDDIGRMEDVFSRGEYSEGYLTGKKGPDNMVFGMSGHLGTPIGYGKINRGRSVSVTPVYTTSPEPGDLVILRGKDSDGILHTVGEITLPKDMTGYIPKPVPMRRNPGEATLTDIAPYRVRREKVEKELAELVSHSEKQEPLTAFFSANVGFPVELILTGSHFGEPVTIGVTGPVVEAATGRPAEEEQVRKSLSKTGGTEYMFTDIQVVIGENCFLPVSVLNNLRRDAITAYMDEIERVDSRENNGSTTVERRGRNHQTTLPSGLTVYTVQTAEQAEAVLNYVNETQMNPENTYLFADMEGDYEKVLSVGQSYRDIVTLGLLSPHITKGSRLEKTTTELQKLAGANAFSAVMVRSMDQLAWAREEFSKESIRIFGDSTLPMMNGRAAESFREASIFTGTISLELRRDEISEKLAAGNLLTVYGRSTVMVSEQCVRKNNGSCDRKSGLSVLQDSTGAEFPVRAVCRYCYNVMYNPHILSLLEEVESGKLPKVGGVRYDFTLESGAETKQVLSGKLPANAAYTKGHWKRGVE